jgi:hypothetical protein
MEGQEDRKPEQPEFRKLFEPFILLFPVFLPFTTTAMMVVIIVVILLVSIGVGGSDDRGVTAPRCFVASSAGGARGEGRFLLVQ